MTAIATVPAAASVSCLWPGETFVCLGTGPSLTPADVDACRGRARVIAVKDALRLAPWADVLYGAGSDGSNWWTRNRSALEGFTGLRFTLDPAAAPWASVLRNTGFTGLETDPSGLRIGKNSGYQAINLAVHLGAARIVLLGYDMDGNSHFFGDHPDGKPRPNYKDFSEYFDTLVEPLRVRGVRIINASRETRIPSFERLTLEEALA